MAVNEQIKTSNIDEQINSSGRLRQDLDREIGARLREARKYRGYKSAREFAIKNNIPESTFSQHETGKRSLNSFTLRYYCKVLGISPYWLLTGREEEFQSLYSGIPAAEVSLNASNRYMRHQKNKSISIPNEDGVSVLDAEFFRGLLQAGLKKFFGVDVNESKVDELLRYCCQKCDSLARITSEHGVQETDSATTTE